MELPQFDSKLIVVGVLLLALIIARLVARKPLDQPVRRARRFGFRGTESPLRDPEAAAKAVQARDADGGKVTPLRDPEREFFGD